MKEDGPDGGHVNMDILSRSVRHRLRDLMDDVSDCPALQAKVLCMHGLQVKSLCDGCVAAPCSMLQPGYVDSPSAIRLATLLCVE